MPNQDDDHVLAAELATTAGRLLLELRAELGFADTNALKDAGDLRSHEFLMTALPAIVMGVRTSCRSRSQLTSHHKIAVAKNGRMTFAQRSQPSTRPSGMVTRPWMGNGPARSDKGRRQM